ncbi:MAG: GNAT family N-acetyltransferase [Tannerella sp.]|jgi:predicted acetyltransferase|nr:GNAT family N-acetyltransferase [Tannerella sp.]
MKEQIMELWQTVFGDSDDFIRLYSDWVYREENVLVIREHGRVVSALQIAPYEMTCCGTTIPIAYVCGVCTLPSERGKGRMTRLMHQALDVMRDRGYALTTLIPASEGLFNLYARFGYATAFDHSVEMHFSEDTPPEEPLSFRIVSSRQLPQETVYEYYDSSQREHPCAVLHTADNWNVLQRDCHAVGGDVWVALWRELPVGLALAVPDGGMMYVRETVCEDPGVRYDLVQHIMTQSGCDMALVCGPPFLPTARPYGMARILDRERMTDLYLSFHHPADTSFLQETDIGRLTQTLLRYDLREAWMNLMLD